MGMNSHDMEHGRRWIRLARAASTVVRSFTWPVRVEQVAAVMATAPAVETSWGAGAAGWKG